MTTPRTTAKTFSSTNRPQKITSQFGVDNVFLLMIAAQSSKEMLSHCRERSSSRSDAAMRFPSLGQLSNASFISHLPLRSHWIQRTEKPSLRNRAIRAMSLLSSVLQVSSLQIVPHRTLDSDQRCSAVLQSNNEPYLPPKIEYSRFFRLYPIYL